MFGLFKGEEGKRGERRYTGTIITVPGQDGFGFIGINTVALENGDPHDISTEKDIFLHRDDCSETPRVGMAVSFTVVPDQHRGPGTFRAMGAVRLVEAELMPPDALVSDPLIGALAAKSEAPTALVLRERRPEHQQMKAVPPDLIEGVIGNQPFSGFLQQEFTSDTARRAFLRELLWRLYPWLEFFGADYDAVNASDEELDRAVEEAVADQEALGLTDQIELMRGQIADFKSIRKALALMWEYGLVRTDTFIPMAKLPDLFMAAPVWYFWAGEEGEARRLAEEYWKHPDPGIHPWTRWFCDRFESKNWKDVFQIFNRRLRTLAQYKGEVISPKLSRRMREATKLFDFVVIATPYYDAASSDWQDVAWVRAIDPYVLGFKEGLPVFFVLGRYSDTGTFPLYADLVADAVDFLRKNKEKLAGFNAGNCPYWAGGGDRPDYSNQSVVAHLPKELREFRIDSGSNGTNKLGDYLMRRVDELLAAFEAGHLFEWLRGEWTLPAAEIPAGVGVEDPVRFGGV